MPARRARTQLELTKRRARNNKNDGDNNDNHQESTTTEQNRTQQNSPVRWQPSVNASRRVPRSQYEVGLRLHLGCHLRGWRLVRRVCNSEVQRGNEDRGIRPQ